MELKELLGEELGKQVQAKIDEHNAGVEDKLKHVRFADLSEGNFVSKAKYDETAKKHEELTARLNTADSLIEKLKKESEDGSATQEALTKYKEQVEQLEDSLKAERTTAAAKVKLIQAGATDVDYILYKCEHDGVKLDDLTDVTISALKEKHSVAFTPDTKPDPAAGGAKPSKGEGGSGATYSADEIRKMSYNEQMALYVKDPNKYNEIMNQ